MAGLVGQRVERGPFPPDTVTYRRERRENMPRFERRVERKF
jgi:hypothetical protein